MAAQNSWVGDIRRCRERLVAELMIGCCGGEDAEVKWMGVEFAWPRPSGNADPDKQGSGRAQTESNHAESRMPTVHSKRKLQTQKTCHQETRNKKQKSEDPPEQQPRAGTGEAEPSLDQTATADHHQDRPGPPEPEEDSNEKTELELTLDPENFNFHKNLPPGVRFWPTDAELILGYLMPKVYQNPLPRNRIMEVNLSEHHPAKLAGSCNQLGEKDYYFFTPRDRKYQNGSRPNRNANGGYWKSIGVESPIKSGELTVGYRRPLVFYDGKQLEGKKTNWIMHEYRLERAPVHRRAGLSDMRLDDWVLCRIYKRVWNRKKEAEEDDPDDENDNSTPPRDFLQLQLAPLQPRRPPQAQPQPRWLSQSQRQDIPDLNQPKTFENSREIPGFENRRPRTSQNLILGNTESGPGGASETLSQPRLLTRAQPQPRRPPPAQPQPPWLPPAQPHTQSLPQSRRQDLPDLNQPNTFENGCEIPGFENRRPGTSQNLILGNTESGPGGASETLSQPRRLTRAQPQPRRPPPAQPHTQSLPQSWRQDLPDLNQPNTFENGCEIPGFENHRPRTSQNLILGNAESGPGGASETLSQRGLGNHGLEMPMNENVMKSLNSMHGEANLSGIVTPRGNELTPDDNGTPNPSMQNPRLSSSPE